MKVRVGISSCLLGERVRWDGGHKRDPGLLRAFEAIAEWVPVCPEVELGMGVPRPALRREPGAGGPRLLEVESGRDHTAAMRSWAQTRIQTLRGLDLRGYVFKSGSPSCGLSPEPGLFAAALVRALPGLPVESAHHLCDAARRADFIRRLLEVAHPA